MADPHPHHLYVLTEAGDCIGYLQTWSRDEVTPAAVHAQYVAAAAVAEWCEVSCGEGRRFVPTGSWVEVPLRGSGGG